MLSFLVNYIFLHRVFYSLRQEVCKLTLGEDEEEDEKEKKGGRETEILRRSRRRRQSREGTKEAYFTLAYLVGTISLKVLTMEVEK